MPLRPDKILDNGEITSSFERHRQRNSAGVDIDARGLPEGSKADVRSPVAGKVTGIGESWGRVTITDSTGNRHEFIHLDFSKGRVKVGDTVQPGDRIGAIGHTVPAGRPSVNDHVHYQIKSPSNAHINPETFDFEGEGS